jgi:DNA-binding LacI/PurR family transcriptional regulator
MKYTGLYGRVYDVSEEESVERLSVAEAAEALGVTRDAIHKRITRGTIEHEKGEDGRFYVYVDTSTEGLDMSVGESVDKTKVEALERLIDSQHDRIAFLEHELDRRGDETARLHQIVAGLTQANAQLSARVPELEPPREATEDAETVEEDSEGPVPRSGRPGSQEAAQGTQASPQDPQEGSRSPWWRRIFGG